MVIGTLDCYNRLQIDREGKRLDDSPLSFTEYTY